MLSAHALEVLVPSIAGLPWTGQNRPVSRVVISCELDKFLLLTDQLLLEHFDFSAGGIQPFGSSDMTSNEEVVCVFHVSFPQPPL